MRVIRPDWRGLFSKPHRCASLLGNQLWSNAALKPSEYSPTVLGLIFLRYADVRFVAVEKELKPQVGSRRKIGPTNFHAAGVVYLPDEARFSHLLDLPEGGDTFALMLDLTPKT